MPAKVARVRGFTAFEGTGESPIAGIVADIAGFLSAHRRAGALSVQPFIQVLVLRSCR